MKLIKIAIFAPQIWHKMKIQGNTHALNTYVPNKRPYSDFKDLGRFYAMHPYISIQQKMSNLKFSKKASRVNPQNTIAKKVGV